MLGRPLSFKLLVRANARSARGTARRDCSSFKQTPALYFCAAALTFAWAGCRKTEATLAPAGESLASSKPADKPAPPRCDSGLDVGDVFERNQVQGVFVLRNEQTGCVATNDPTLAALPFRPQSTFKIPNSLIGLQTGILSGPNHTFIWDKAPRRLPQWEQNLTLKQALNFSCVPCFQELARSIGASRMQSFIDKMNYGNRDISGPIDMFWLNGALRISPIEQVDFVHRSLAYKLPFDKKHVDLVWMLLEQDPEGQLRVFAKTGLGQQAGRAIGWVLGYVQKGKDRWGFASLVRGQANQDPQKEMTRIMSVRMPLTRQILSSLKRFGEIVAQRPGDAQSLNAWATR